MLPCYIARCDKVVYNSNKQQQALVIRHFECGLYATDSHRTD